MRTSARTRLDEQDSPLGQADLKTILPFPPSKNIPRVSLWTSLHPPASPQLEGGDRNTSSASHSRGASRDKKTCPAKPQSTSKASIHLTSSRSQLGPPSGSHQVYQQSIPLRSTTKTEPEAGQRTRCVVKLKKKNEEYCLQVAYCGGRRATSEGAGVGPLRCRR
jgi:hypothetical protein